MKKKSAIFFCKNIRIYGDSFISTPHIHTYVTNFETVLKKKEGKFHLQIFIQNNFTYYKKKTGG